MRLVVSTLLLIFLTTVAAGFLFHAYVTGLIGRFMNFSEGLRLLYLDSAYVNATCVTANVRNMGGADVIITEAYVDDAPHSLSQSVEIARGSVGTVYINGMYTKGTTYVVKLVSNNGYSITFNVTYE